MLRLQSRFSISIVSLIIGIITLLATALLVQFSSLSKRLIDTSSHKMSETLLGQMEQRGEAITRLLADNLVNPLYTYNMSEMYEILRIIKLQEDVQFAYVYDAHGKIIQDGTKDVFKFGHELEDAGNRLAIGVDEPLISQIHEDALEVSIPIWIGDKALGGLIIGLSLEAINSEISTVLNNLDQIGKAGLKKNYITVGLTALALVIFGIITALSVARYLIRPIKEVSDYAGKVGGGEYGELISIRRTDELGDLIDAFNRMSQNLMETTVSKDYVESIISNMSDPLIVLRTDGKIKLANHATAALLEYPKTELADKSYEILFPPNSRRPGNDLTTVLSKNGSFPHTDEKFVTKNGRLIPISLSGTVIKNKESGVVEFILVAQDITKRIKEQTELKAAKEEAESASKAKSEFLANMSHELRTPLNHIIGFTELVVDQNLGDLNEIQVEYLSDSLTSSRHLLSLINDILDIAKVEAGKLELEPMEFDLKALLTSSLVMVKEQAMKNEIELTTNINGLPETITADERKLKQIIYNLLSNAVKFTSHGGQVCLSSKKVSAKDLRLMKIELPEEMNLKHKPMDFIEISVSDSGIGITSEDIDRIFRPFEQVENSASRKFQGTGLGLSLTKSLVELHGGSIWASSEGHGKGSTFSFIVPMNQPCV